MMWENVLMLLSVPKRERTIKASWCADGQPQRTYTYKEDTSSPTVTKRIKTTTHTRINGTKK